jgi:hypothetical protein
MIFGNDYKPEINILCFFVFSQSGFSWKIIKCRAQHT